MSAFDRWSGPPAAAVPSATKARSSVGVGGLLYLDVELAHDLAPVAEIGGELRRQVLGRGSGRRQAERAEPALHVRGLHDLDQLGIEPPDDGVRRAGRRENPVPRIAGRAVRIEVGAELE